VDCERVKPTQNDITSRLYVMTVRYIISEETCKYALFSQQLLPEQTHYYQLTMCKYFSS